MVEIILSLLLAGTTLLAPPDTARADFGYFEAELDQLTSEIRDNFPEDSIMRSIRAEAESLRVKAQERRFNHKLLNAAGCSLGGCLGSGLLLTTPLMMIAPPFTILLGFLGIWYSPLIYGCIGYHTMDWEVPAEYRAELYNLVICYNHRRSKLSNELH